MKYKKLLENIYFAAYHHKELNWLLKNDLLRDDLERKKAEGSFNAYSFIVQMIEHHDTIGQTDYKKVFKMKNPKPYFMR